MSNTLTLGRINFNPLNRMTIGLDEMLEELTRMTSSGDTENYPPHNLIKINDEAYAIEMAVAGFELDDIDINLENNHLIVSGSRSSKSSVESTYIHKGIGARDFVKTFTLGNYIEVNGANLKNGILSISLARILPKNMKSQKISIKNNN